MTSGSQSGEVTHPAQATGVAWTSVAPGQPPVPVMPLSLSAMLLSLHVIHGVLGTFQRPSILQTVVMEKPTGHGDRLFTLPPHLINVEDIRQFTPRKRHLKPQKLLRRLGKNFDPFWMSVDLPEDLLETQVRQTVDDSLAKELGHLNLAALEHALKSVSNSSNNTTADGGGRMDTPAVVEVVKDWLVKSGSCPVYYRWEDLGLLYWPRWVRQGMCSPEDSSMTSASSSKLPPAPSCSWPPGMHCVPAKAKRLRILRWQCRHNKALNNFRRFHQMERNAEWEFSDKLANENKARERRELLPGGENLVEGIGDTLRFVLGIAEHNQQRHNTTSNSSWHISPKTQHEADKEYQLAGHAGLTDKPNSEASHYKKTSRTLLRSTEGTSFVRSVGKQNNQRRQKRDVEDEDDEMNDTENWNKMSWKERRRKLNLRCRWIKIPYPVTDDCYCSC